VSNAPIVTAGRDWRRERQLCDEILDLAWSNALGEHLEHRVGSSLCPAAVQPGARRNSAEELGDNRSANVEGVASMARTADSLSSGADRSTMDTNRSYSIADQARDPRRSPQPEVR
jgi:hypothetical protein